MSIYCVYLTVYRGNKFPPFYIGSTKVDRIHKEGYRGSVSSKQYSKIWKKELKENPHLFKIKILSTFPTGKLAREREKDLQIKLNVVRSPMYINKATAQPNGFAGMDVDGENNPFYGKTHSAETREKLCNAKRGKNHPFYGKKRPEHSKAMKGRKNSSTHNENISKANKGKHHGTPKGELTSYMKKNLHKYLPRYILATHIRNMHLVPRIPYGINTKTGKLITYYNSVSKEFGDKFGVDTATLAKILAFGSEIMYREAEKYLKEHASK